MKVFVPSGNDHHTGAVAAAACWLDGHPLEDEVSTKRTLYLHPKEHIILT